MKNNEKETDRKVLRPWRRIRSMPVAAGAVHRAAAESDMAKRRQAVADGFEKLEGAVMPPGARMVELPTDARAGFGAFEAAWGREDDTEGGRPIVVMAWDAASTALRRLARAGALEPEHLVAGERYHADWMTAGLERRVTMRWDLSPRGSGEAWSDVKIDAGERVATARRVLMSAGVLVLRVVDAVVIEGETLSSVYATHYQRDKSREAANTGLLIAGLGLLSSHYSS